jgi:single-strand DNA-binding protein
MLNQIVLVGKVVELPTLRETSSGNKVANLLLEVDRNFRNTSGEYDKDLIMCTLWRGVAETASSVCEIGSLVGVKGRLQANSFETKDNRPFYYCEVIAEKVSFLQPKS